MTIKETIDSDIKSAMLAGDKVLVTTLRGLKSAILYAEVANGTRDTGLSDQEVTSIFQKEAKKRQESAELYRKGNNLISAEAEEAEHAVIQSYLPEMLSEDEVRKLVKAQADELQLVSTQQMGQLISAVKQKAGGAVDGALVARIAKEYLQ
jgi:uncharacterized protein YqeY